MVLVVKIFEADVGVIFEVDKAEMRLIVLAAVANDIARSNLDDDTMF